MIPFGGKMCSLRTKILTSLLLICSLSISAVLFGIWKYQQEKFLADTRQKAILVGSAIVTALNSAMLREDHAVIQKSLEDLAINPIKRISLISKKGVIDKSSQREMIGLNLVKGTSRTCQACHQVDAPSSGVVANVLEDEIIENKGDPVLQTIIPIANKPECHGCHPASDVRCGLGVLVIDYSLHDTYEILRTVTKRTILTGGITFLVIIFSISLIVSRFVGRPIDEFMEGIRKVENGDFKTWLNVNTSGEFAEMALSFNVMVRAVSRYIREVREKNREIAILFSIMQRMSETIELKKVKSILLNLLTEILNVNSVLLVMPLDTEAEYIEIACKRKDDKRHYVLEYPLSSFKDPSDCLSRDELECWLHNEINEPMLCEGDNRALIPLKLKAIKLGLICMRKAPGESFSFAEKELLPNITKHISVAFGNARFFYQATTDTLTSLYTKRYFETELKYLVEGYHMTNSPFCLMILDLDYFKKVNDTYGHQAGDLVLSELSRLMRKNLRHGDVACRYGGEEFVILMPETELDAAVAVAERLRSQIAEHEFDIGGVTIHKSISIGVAACPDHASEAKALVRIADAALYAAKDGGRNRVNFAPVVLPDEAKGKKKISTREEEKKRPVVPPGCYQI